MLSLIALLALGAPDPLAPLPPPYAAFLPTVPGAINPAVTADNLDQTICNKTLFDKHGAPVPVGNDGKPLKPGFTWVHLQRPSTGYTNKIKFALMAAAGISRSDSAKYELDHLWSIEAGGSPTDPRNLWLQPYVNPYGAKLKDRLENRIHDRICARATTIEQGGHDLTFDWIEAYAAILGPVQ